MAALLLTIGDVGQRARANGPPASPVEQRIIFKRGAIESVSIGRLQSMSDQLHFVVRARARQHMRLTLEAAGPTRGTVVMPNGDKWGEPGDAFFDDVLPADGDYRIRITEASMGESWAGKVLLHVWIK